MECEKKLMARNRDQMERAVPPQAPELRPILVVSNRLPITAQKGPRGLEVRPSAGGLVSAIEPVLQRRGGTWIGWPGADVRADKLHRREGYRMRPVQLSENEVTRYYHGFSNRTLWPLFHCFAEHARFDWQDWRVYEAVNRRFAEEVVTTAGERDLIWIHDYHLMLAPRFVRNALHGARIAFFLHIPFPPYDLFRVLPWNREILRALLAADLVGFHVQTYVRNFLDCVQNSLSARVDRKSGLVEYADHTLQVGAFPIGIDYDQYESMAREAPPAPTDDSGVQIVLGVDRLDYTKGIPERIHAFERLLELYPEHREKVVFLQLAVPSRSQVSEYRNLKRQIDELVGRVNGRFSTATWSPIRYLYQNMPTEKLTALYRDADVALITPVRDGMNLVAKEYVTCQVDKPGVLVLSKLAGAAETMHEAILVNPYDVDGTAAGLHRALVMDEAERRSRLAALRRRERRYNVTNWVNRFIEAMPEVKRGLEPPTSSDFEEWIGPFLGDYHLALFLGFDGVLVPFADQPTEATMDAGMRRALHACLRRKNTDVAIVTRRPLDQIRALIDHPALTYAANHGLEIMGPGLPHFEHADAARFEEKASALARDISNLNVGGLWTERMGPTLTVHYGAVRSAEQPKIIERIRTMIAKAGFQPREIHMAVEARLPIPWEDGHAILHIVHSRFGPAWSETLRFVYIGADATDESTFGLLSGMGITFRIGSADILTAASRRLPNIFSVRALLEWIAKRPARSSVLPATAASRA
jgi:trehalose 6-phosphate synthase/phosphatase